MHLIELCFGLMASLGKDDEFPIESRYKAAAFLLARAGLSTELFSLLASEWDDQDHRWLDALSSALQEKNVLSRDQVVR